MLSTISDKDLRDTPADILQNHLDNVPQYDKPSAYKHGCLCARHSCTKGSLREDPSVEAGIEETVYSDIRRVTRRGEG